MTLNTKRAQCTMYTNCTLISWFFDVCQFLVMSRAPINFGSCVYWDLFNLISFFFLVIFLLFFIQWLFSIDINRYRPFEESISMLIPFQLEYKTWILELIFWSSWLFFHTHFLGWTHCGAERSRLFNYYIIEIT